MRIPAHSSLPGPSSGKYGHYNRLPEPSSSVHNQLCRRLLNGLNVFNKPIGNDPAVAEHTSEPAWVPIAQIKILRVAEHSDHSLLDETRRVSPRAPALYR